MPDVHRTIIVVIRSKKDRKSHLNDADNGTYVGIPDTVVDCGSGGIDFLQDCVVALHNSHEMHFTR
jgi:hypothetical protein